MREYAHIPNVKLLFFWHLAVWAPKSAWLVFNPATSFLHKISIGKYSDFFHMTLNQKFPTNLRLGTCKFVLSMLSKTESPGVSNIETDNQRNSQTGSDCRVHNINSLLLDSTVIRIVLAGLACR